MSVNHSLTDPLLVNKTFWDIFYLHENFVKFFFYLFKSCNFYNFSHLLIYPIFLIYPNQLT